MKPPDSGRAARGSRFSLAASAFVILLGLVAIVATFLVAGSNIEATTKSRAFAAIVVAFLGLSLSALFGARRLDTQTGPETSLSAGQGLEALAAAGEFFAGALDREDTFRLIAHRVREIVSFRSAALYTLDTTRSELELSVADGPDAGHFRSREAVPTVAVNAFNGRRIERAAATTSTRPEIAVPLSRDEAPFGVLLLEFDLATDIADLDEDLLEAVATRVAPLVLGSMSYERNRENALMDPVTSIPNERALRLVLENQIAESCRRGSARPLTVLALDVRSFDDINLRFGHAAGDRLLESVARLLTENLRQMDMLARSSADEFLAILPTASREISHEIITRIQTAFFGRKIRIADGESVEVDLNIGWASFGADGETAEALLSAARQRKLHTKSAAGNLVLFPVEITA